MTWLGPVDWSPVLSLVQSWHIPEIALQENVFGLSFKAACANFPQLRNFLFFSQFFLLLLLKFLQFLLIFAQFWAFFAHILCANFSDSTVCLCYFVSFFHLCQSLWVKNPVFLQWQGLGDILQNRIWPFYGPSHQTSFLMLCSNRMEPLMATAGNCVRICPSCKQPWASCCRQC